MYVLVNNGEISGETDSPENVPMGFQVYEFQRKPLNSLFFDGKNVAIIPPPPDENCVWAGRGWVTNLPDPVPHIDKATEDTLFEEVYRAVYLISPEIADTLSYMLSKQENNVEGWTKYREKLREHGKRLKAQRLAEEKARMPKPPA